MTVTLIVLVIVLAIGAFLISTYNQLVQYRNRFKNAYSQIDVQLKRRYDLIPNLVEVAKTYLKHERETLEAVVTARNQAAAIAKQAAASPGAMGTMHELASAEGALSGALGRLFAVAESYPDLKASQNMAQLTEELSSTENKVSFSRQAFNDAVTDYNNARETFPAVLFAASFGFSPAELLESATEAERQPVRVAFS